MTVKFLVTLTQVGGFVVTPVLDGDYCHHSKRASTKRRTLCKISRINAVQTRFKALSVSSKTNSGTVTQEEKKEFDELNSKAEKLE